MALRQDQKLFPHFGEARTTVFAVEQVQYGGHDRAPSFDDRCGLRYHTPGAQTVNQVTGDGLSRLLWGNLPLRWVLV